VISTRFAPAVIALVALALVPTVIHSYVGRLAHDDFRTTAIPARLGDEIGTATNRRPQWGMVQFSAEDWIERSYGARHDLTLFVGRSFDAKRLYHHPELAVAYGDSYRPATVGRFPRRPDVPVHVLRHETDSNRVSMYALLYDGQFVENPIRFQLMNGLELLFSRRKPMTLFFVRDMGRGARDPIERSDAAALLLTAISNFESQARPTR
jgi:hypothetical protein